MERGGRATASWSELLWKSVRYDHCGREKRALEEFSEFSKDFAKNGNRRETGVFEAVCEDPNEYGRCQRNARDVNDLSLSGRKSSRKTEPNRARRRMW